jgi:tryptophan-rich sensory protein
MKDKIRNYAVSIAISLGTGILSALVTMGNMDLYSEITRPPLSPPSILFPIVWTILYTLMGISTAMIYEEKDAQADDVKSALTVYAISLFLNFFWSIFFFNMQAFLFSFIWLVALWISILITIIKFYRIKPIAGILQIP